MSVDAVGAACDKAIQQNRTWTVILSKRSICTYEFVGGQDGMTKGARATAEETERAMGRPSTTEDISCVQQSRYSCALAKGAEASIRAIPSTRSASSGSAVEIIRWTNKVSMRRSDLCQTVKKMSCFESFPLPLIGKQWPRWSHSASFWYAPPLPRRCTSILFNQHGRQSQILYPGCQISLLRRGPTDRTSPYPELNCSTTRTTRPSQFSICPPSRHSTATKNWDAI